MTRRPPRALQRLSGLLKLDNQAHRRNEDQMPSIQKRPNGRWRARYQDPDGRWRARHFDRKVDAERYLDKIRGDLARAEWIDPKGARTRFGEYVAGWQAGQVQHRGTTAAQLDSRLKIHVLPFFANRPIGSIRASEVRAWVAGRSAVLAPATVANCYRWLSTIMRAAVADRLIAASPCVGIKLPRIDRERVVPFSTDQVLELIEATPERHRALVVLAAGSGLRQGELLGLDAARIDWLGRAVRVDRQLVTPARGEPSLGPPKTEASRRVVPVADEVLLELSEHVRRFSPGEGLLFTARDGAPLRRSRAAEMWRRVVEQAASVPEGAKFHELRHYFASLLIRQGSSVKAVQAALGHASATETLNTYSHLWPDDDERIRAAVAAELGAALGIARDQRGTQAPISAR
jgi:integrase